MYFNENITYSLPTSLIKKIVNDLYPNHGKQFDRKNSFFKCILILYYKQINEYPSKLSYVNASSGYWKKIFSGTYKERIIKPLMDTGIIQVRDYRKGYIQYDGDIETQPEKRNKYHYRINPELLNDELGTIYFLKKGQKLPDKKRAIPDQKYYPTEYQKKVLRITIDQGAPAWIDENARRICEENLHLNYVDALPKDFVIGYRELIEEGSFKKKKHLPIDELKDIAEKEEKQLFHYKDEYYMAHLDTFIQLRSEGIKYNYKMDVSRLKNMPLISDRNVKTLRVYNQLTNFPSMLLPFLRLNGELMVQIDLSTSQFLLFANLINIYLNEGEERVKSLFKQKETKRYINRFITKIKKYKTVLPSSGINGDEPLSDQQKHHDTLQFIYDVFYRDFYTHVGQLLNIQDRGLAKTTLFQQLFRKRSRNDAFDEILREHYPTVMNIMDEFKKQSKKEETESNADDENEANNLSVFLQCVEAEIYIDRVLQPLQKNKTPCFSRHDSICIPESYKGQVQEYISDVFNDLGFKYKDKPEYNSVNEVKTTDIEDFDDVYENNLPEHIVEAISRIEIQDDYSDEVDADLLEEFASISGLTQQQINCLEDDVVNLRRGMNFLQNDTNQFITELIATKNGNSAE